MGALTPVLVMMARNKHIFGWDMSELSDEEFWQSACDFASAWREAIERNQNVSHETEKE